MGAALVSEETRAWGPPCCSVSALEALTLVSSDHCWNFPSSPEVFLESNCSSKLPLPTPAANSSTYLFLD